MLYEEDQLWHFDIDVLKENIIFIFLQVILEVALQFPLGSKTQGSMFEWAWHFGAFNLKNKWEWYYGSFQQ